MDALAAVFAMGFLATWVALYQRAGFPPSRGWLEFLLPNLWWFGLMAVKTWGWPITFAHWLYNGRRPSQWQAATSLDGREVRRIVRVTDAAGPAATSSRGRRSATPRDGR